MFQDENGWVNAYQNKGALWIHDGNPSRPHALLTSGKHSSLFFNARQVIPDRNLLEKAAFDLVDKLLILGEDIRFISRVVGPQTGATKLAEFISTAIASRRGYGCLWASPAKGEDKEMIWDDPGRKVLPGERVLLCEDTVTTAGSVLSARKAVVTAGGIPMNHVLVLVNRSGFLYAGNQRSHLVSLITQEGPLWEPDDCPLCKGVNGVTSEAIPAKDPENWARLNAKM
jgi:orotate phosphoribosyltransferase